MLITCSVRTPIGNQGLILKHGHGVLPLNSYCQHHWMGRAYKEEERVASSVLDDFFIIPFITATLKVLTYLWIVQIKMKVNQINIVERTIFLNFDSFQITFHRSQGRNENERRVLRHAYLFILEEYLRNFQLANNFLNLLWKKENFGPWKPFDVVLRSPELGLYFVSPVHHPPAVTTHRKSENWRRERIYWQKKNCPKK